MRSLDDKVEWEECSIGLMVLIEIHLKKLRKRFMRCSHISKIRVQ